MKSNQLLRSVVAIALFGVILLIGNAISRVYLSHWSWDLTQERLYTLSDGTKSILRELPQPITVRFYFSRQASAGVPGIRLYGQRVLDLLKEYEKFGAGKVLLRVHDPLPDSEDEEWAERYGIQALNLPSGERLYLGAALIDSSGQEEVVPFIDPNRQRTLEYDLTKAIHKLTRDSIGTIGIISSIDFKASTPPAPGQEQAPGWFFVQQLEELAKVVTLPADVAEVGAKIDLLLLVHPRDLSEQTRYALDQYVMGGGRLIVLVDPYSEAAMAQAPAGDGRRAQDFQASDANLLLEKWGVKLTPDRAVADRLLATPVGIMPGAPPVPFMLWLTLNDEVINADEPAIGGVQQLLFPWVGSLEVSEVDGVRVETLFRSSSQAALASKEDYSFGGGRPDYVADKYRRASEEFILGVKLTGTLPSSFAGPLVAAEDMSPRHLTQSVNGATVVVVADVDFLSDRFSLMRQNFFGRQIATPLNDNLTMFNNLVDHLLGSNDLIAIRSRGRFSRPFTVVQKLEARATDRWRNEEMVLQAKLNEANQRLRQLQAGTDQAQTTFSAALVEEMRRFREERLEASRKLRELRHRLREDKARLGEVLFLVNTFAIPVLIVVFALLRFLLRLKREKSKQPATKGMV